MAYRIRDWESRYEVNDKNRALKPGDKMRQGRLEYLRFPVHGRDWTAAYRRFLKEAKDDAPMVYGVYVKLKEVAAQADAGMRGVIRDDSGVPIEAESIAEYIGFPVKCVVKALEILCRENVGWVERFRDSPEIPGNSPSESYTESETETNTEPPLVGVGECPLASLPKIASAYTKIRDCILENHPKAILPELGTEKELNDRKELERLIRLDGYTESDVIKTLKWVLREEPPGDFTWRAQFRSLSALRTVKDGATKFTKMYEAMNRHKAPPPEKCPFSKDDELYPEWIRQKALGLV